MTALTIEGTTRQVVAGFDYSELPKDTAQAAQAARERIHRRMNGQIKNIIETGDDLLHVKELLGHGQFTAWVTTEFGMTQRTATNYMRAAEAFRGKTEIISDLPVAAVYMLAAAPEETRDAIVSRVVSSGAPTEQEIKDALYDARAERKKFAQEAKLSPRQRKSRAQREAEYAAQRQKHEAEAEAARQAGEEAARLILSALTDDQVKRIAGLVEKSRYRLVDALLVGLAKRKGSLKPSE